MQTGSLINPNPKFNRNLSTGFQRVAVKDEPNHDRDMLRITFSGTVNGPPTSPATPPVPADVTYEPLQRADVHNFRPNSVTCCAAYAAVNRSGNTPVLVKFGYHRNSITMSPQGNGPSFGSDNTVAVITPNQGNTYQPGPAACGAIIPFNNLLGQQLRIQLTDITGATLTDVSNYFISLCFFERD